MEIMTGNRYAVFVDVMQMNKYEEIANEIIELVSSVIEEHYGIEPKNITDDDIENPALINGTIYYDLESAIADKIKSLVETKPVYLVEYIDMNDASHNSMEGYSVSEEAFKKWLEQHNKQREADGEEPEQEFEFKLTELHNLEVNENGE